MIVTKETIYTKDASNKKLRVVREFDAPVKDVWQAWTEPKLLDEWWAPKPWKAITVSMDFRAGGRWLYYMQGPEGERHYCVCEYKTINPNKSYSGLDAFTDDKGNITDQFPRTMWHVDFNSIGEATRVEVELSFDSEADMEKMAEMGFREGFASAHNNLDELLAKKV